MRPRVQIGTVIEIATARGFAYAQYTHEHQQYGSLLRVLPGTYKSRPNDLSEVVAAPERFRTFYVLAAALRKPPLVEVVGVFPIPPSARELPVFRQDLALDPTGRALTRRLWTAHGGFGPVKPATAEDLDLPLLVIPNHVALVHDIESDWTPARADEFRAKARAARAAAAPREMEGPRQLEHRVYFTDRQAATDAANSLRERGLKVRVRKNTPGEWLLHAAGPADQSDSTSVRRIAEKFGGDYDGWELGPAPAPAN